MVCLSRLWHRFLVDSRSRRLPEPESAIKFRATPDDVRELTASIIGYLSLPRNRDDPMSKQLIPVQMSLRGARSSLHGTLDTRKQVTHVNTCLRARAGTGREVHSE